MEIIERAGHNPHDEQIAEVMRIVTDFLASVAGAPGGIPGAGGGGGGDHSAVHGAAVG